MWRLLMMCGNVTKNKTKTKFVHIDKNGSNSFLARNVQNSIMVEKLIILNFGKKCIEFDFMQADQPPSFLCQSKKIAIKSIEFNSG